MKLTVVGASGPVGRAVVRQAIDASHEVVAVTRHPDPYGLSASKLEVHGGDVLEAQDVSAAVDGADAVISTLGVPDSLRTITTFSTGTRNVLGAMRTHDVKRCGVAVW